MKTQPLDTRPGATPVHLPALVAFDAVARHLNFARAAAELAVTPTAVSRTIKALEAQLGVRVFHRTTRSVGLTEAGRELVDAFAPALEQIRRAVQRVGDASGRPYGTLRVNTSYVAYASVIEPHLPAFRAAYPDVSLDVSLDNALVDIVAGGYDVGIRLGEALHKDMIALPVGPVQRLVPVASPDYLAAHGVPRRPEELLAHDCIRQRLSARARFVEWTFRRRGRTFVVDVKGRLVVDDMRAALSAAERGCGIAYVFAAFAHAAVVAGRLVALLERDCPDDEVFHFYYPGRAHVPGKLRAFVDFLRAANAPR
ncbi:MAG TPA: LysR family transcriptional regulator [Tahibacter sp.]|nr:LysR family transcriptional regulator [Tahibacter sp.]